tara:strand:- start:1714 stop:2472 length:759 start_codon:yes stop_codon:yes gene_type:complete
MNKNFFCKKPFINLYKKNNKNSEIVSQIIYGEKLRLIKKKSGWLYVKNTYDNYKGYIENIQLEHFFIPTHKVTILKSLIYKKNKKSKFIKTKKFLPFCSKINIINKSKKFSNFQNNEWLKNKDLVKIDYIEKNLIKVVKSFLNIKYIWGGKTYKGIDCSALLQIFFQFNNIFVPRDSKDQEKFFKKNTYKFLKNNLIFWKGHIAICISKKLLIHAYGPKKKVIVMNIKKTINEIKNNTNLNIIKIKQINAIR